MSDVLAVLAWVLVVYFGIYVVGVVAMAVTSGLLTRRRRHTLLPSTLRRIMRAELTPPISLCIPAHDEAAVIVDTVRSVLALDYPLVEVVVANDGSTDATLDVLRREFALEPTERPRLAELPHAPVRGLYAPRAPIPLLVVDKPNGGRSDALNAALSYARGPLVVVIDADELVANDTLARAVMPFLAHPESTIAAGATLGVANGCTALRGRILAVDRPRRLLPLFQAVEYERVFRIPRLAAERMRALAIISGGFGIFRRDALLAPAGTTRTPSARTST